MGFYEYLAKTPHYMLCGSNLRTQRYGLGLLIVRQVMEVHHGTMEITKNYDKGIRLPFIFRQRHFLPVPCLMAA